MGVQNFDQKQKPPENPAAFRKIILTNSDQKS